MATSSIYSLPLIALIVVVIVVAGVGGALVYLQQHPKPVTPRQTVQVGDNVTVNYIGTFGSGAESGRVFDTSIYSVYVDNVTYPKSLFFPYTHGGSPSNYTALGVHVGPNAPSYTIGSISFVSVVPGFWQGLLGLPVGETRTISVSPSLGYGPADPSCFVTKDLTYTMPVYTALNLTAFQTAYPNVTASPGVEFPDPQYGWPVLVLSSNGVTVSIENLPTVGERSDPSGWPVVVSQISGTPNGSGKITLVNQLTQSQSGLVLGNLTSGSPPCSSSAGDRFIVSNVNPATGTYTEDFNSEVTAQTLLFTVTVVQFY
jgi:FKBP-type peptidyl-prolyl cis-trans isomerase 2